jgi:hypothetical protein
MFSDVSAFPGSRDSLIIFRVSALPANPFMQYSLKMKYLAGVKIRARYNASPIPHNFNSLENK